MAIVLIAHGSRTVAANKAHRKMAVDLEAMLGMPVWAAFLELADPLIPAAIHQATAAGATKVLVLPYFLYPGRPPEPRHPRTGGHHRGDAPRRRDRDDGRLRARTPPSSACS